MSTFTDAMKFARQRTENRESSTRLKEVMGILRKYDVSHGLTPEKAVNILEELGPTFVKLGQIASTHPDVLPQEYCDAFATLRTHVAPMSIETVRMQVESELGRPVDEVFSEFDDHALGSASIAQVHRAVLREGGQTVAVKVQRPGTVETVTRDLALMDRLLVTYEALSQGDGSLSLKSLVDELERTSHDELDFTIEADNLERFYDGNAGRKGVSCPRCYREYCTDAILVEDFASGPTIGQIDTLDGISAEQREKLAYLIADNYMQQILKDGFFHADPHAGNILICGLQPKSSNDAKPAAAAGAEAETTATETAASTSATAPTDGTEALATTPDSPSTTIDGPSPDDSVASPDDSVPASGKPSSDDAAKTETEAELGIEWIDFGMMGTLTSKDRDTMMDIVTAIAKGDAYGLKRAMLKLARPTGPIDHASLLALCDEMIDQYAHTDLVSFNTAELINGLMQSMQQQGFEFEPSVVMLGRGLVTLEGTIRIVSDRINVAKVLERYVRSSVDFSKAKESIRKVAGASLDSAQAMTELPTKALDTLDMLQKGQVRMDTSLSVDSKTRTELVSSIDHFTLMLMAAGLFMGSCILCLTGLQPQVFGVPLLGLIGFVTGLGIALFDFYEMRKEKRLRK